MRPFKPIMFAVVAGMSLLTVPAIAAGDGPGTTGATSATKDVPPPSGPAPVAMQSSAPVPGTPTQNTPANAPAKASGVGGEGSGGGK
jgi:hypothetical protein